MAARKAALVSAKGVQHGSFGIDKQRCAMGLRQAAQWHTFDLQRIGLVGNERVAGDTWKSGNRAHLADDAGAAGGAAPPVLENRV